jgi:serine-type D-Ala-D-Ala carboxypeptidase/endopeptidase (penicillin-binding protein 4)
MFDCEKVRSPSTRSAPGEPASTENSASCRYFGLPRRLYPPMRAFLGTLASVCLLLAGTASAAIAQPPPAAEQALQRSLSQGMATGGSSTGAYVVDLSTGQVLFSQSPNTGRLPASVEKIYTTSTALLKLGPAATFTTSILGVGAWAPGRVWNGTLYLVGGGDPTFGSVGFDHTWYGTGATMHSLVMNLLNATGIKAVSGGIVGDGSYFDSRRGTPATGFAPSLEVEGELGALAYDRGFANLQGTALQARPALFAARQLAGSLRAMGVKLPRRTRIATGRTPAGATVLATVHSPPLSTLIALTNTPSDNYFAETLLKDLGARLGTGGTTAAGAAVVRAEIQSEFGFTPTLDDGSGLSRYDSSTPVQVVTALESLVTNQTFVNSLALMGETGTLQDEGRGTLAQGNCRGKTGTLSDVANLAGYCRASDGHMLVFAFMGNGLGDPDYFHQVEAGMAAALANYDG